MVRWTISLLLAAAVLAAPAAAQTAPTLVRDVKTGMWKGGTRDASAPVADYVQPDTEIEPSIAVNPNDPNNAVAVYQEGRIDSGGDATNGYATTFDGGRTWQYGELPGLTTFPGQGGSFDRASDAVVAFGPDNLVYANSLVFDSETDATRSGITVNVSKDGGRTWSPPVAFQDDNVGGTNDKNWIVVDNGDGPGHHKGRVYVVWDRVAPIVYDYCDHDCDQLANWLPTLQTIDPVAFPGQGLGAYPVVTDDGGLAMALTMLGGALPVSPFVTDQPEPEEYEGLATQQAIMLAPGAGSTPWPAPLAWTPPAQVAFSETRGQPAQRGPEGIPSLTVNRKTGTLHYVWDDGRGREHANDVVISSSTDGGATWSKPAPVNPGPRDDFVDHYGATIDSGSDGTLHVAYRVRDEAEPFSPYIDSYYQESKDDGKTWSAPLKVNRKPSDMRYGAFSRSGTFEGDYDQIASMGGSTYFVRCQGAPAAKGEPFPLDPADTTMSFVDENRGHQHQSCYVSLIQDLPPGAAVDIPGPTPRPGSHRKPIASLKLRLVRTRLPRHRLRLRLKVKAPRLIEQVRFAVGRKRLRPDRKAPFQRVVKLRKRRLVIRAVVVLSDGRRATLRRRTRG
jgi:hypothetical protein